MGESLGFFGCISKPGFFNREELKRKKPSMTEHTRLELLNLLNREGLTIHPSWNG